MLAILSINHRRKGWYPIDIPRFWWFYLGFSPRSPKNPPRFLNESIPACSKKWNKTKISPIPMFPSHYPSCSGLSSRFPSFSPSGYAIIFRSSHIIPSLSQVFSNVASRPMGDGKNINPTRLVVTSGKLLFYLSGGGTGIEPKENPKKKHSDARLFDSPAVLDFSLAKNKPAWANHRNPMISSSHLPSGKHPKSYWKWPSQNSGFLDLPIDSIVIFHSYSGFTH